MITIKKNLKQFLNVFKVINNICTETDITCYLDKIYIKAVHPSNHCMLVFELNKSFFDNYKVEKEITYTVDISTLLKIMSKFKKDLKIDFVGDKIEVKDDKLHFSLNYFVSNKDTRTTPSFDYESTWSIDTSTLFSITAKLSDFSDICKFEGKKELRLYTKSNLVEGNLILDSTKKGDKDSECYFGIDYINYIKDIQNIFENITLGFDNELPMTINGTSDDINFKFILAGTVE